MEADSKRGVEKGLTILMKTLILDHEDLVFDNNCNLMYIFSLFMTVELKLRIMST